MTFSTICGGREGGEEGDEEEGAGVRCRIKVPKCCRAFGDYCRTKYNL